MITPDGTRLWVAEGKKAAAERRLAELIVAAMDESKPRTVTSTPRRNELRKLSSIMLAAIAVRASSLHLRSTSGTAGHSDQPASDTSATEPTSKLLPCENGLSEIQRSSESSKSCQVESSSCPSFLSGRNQIDRADRRTPARRDC